MHLLNRLLLEFTSCKLKSIDWLILASIFVIYMLIHMLCRLYRSNNPEFVYAQSRVQSLRGKKIVATNPGRYYQYIDIQAKNIAWSENIHIKSPPQYWIRITHVGKSYIMYDSYMSKPNDRIVRSLAVDKECSIATFLLELDEGFLKVEGSK